MTPSATSTFDRINPTHPNLSSTVNLTPRGPSIESLRNCDPSIERTHQAEETEEKKDLKKIPRSLNFSLQNNVSLASRPQARLSPVNQC
jgi:hypothetical protein